MNSMAEVLADYAKKQPEELYCVDPNTEITYAAAWNLVMKAARKMRGLGVAAGDRVMVECTQNHWFLIADYACEIIGAIFVPVEHKASADRIGNIAAETEPQLFLCEVEHENELPMMLLKDFMGAGDMALSEEERKAVRDPAADDAAPEGTPEIGAASEEDAPAAFRFPEAEAVAEILYTTGTTGKSKGIEITNVNNIALAENIMYGTKMKKGNREILPLPLSHSHGIRCCYANLLNGGTILILDGIMKVAMVFKMLKDYRATAMDLSPAAIQILMRLSKGKLSDYREQLDYIEVGTAALPEETKKMMIDSFDGVRLYNFYGSTESGRTCALDFNAERGRANCIGKPTKNAHFIVTDDDRNEIVSSEENPGLLASAGPMNMRGYYKQPLLTDSVMKNGFIYTNDLGYIDGEGFVYVLGRKDDIINYKGIKIAPEEIEETVRAYPAVEDCACVPKKDKAAGQIPKLFIAVKDGGNFVMDDFYAFLRERLDHNKLPKEVEIIDSIPRTYNGKLQRAKLASRV